LDFIVERIERKVGLRGSGSLKKDEYGIEGMNMVEAMKKITLYFFITHLLPTFYLGF